MRSASMCALCGTELAQAGLERVAEMNLCDMCVAGQFGDRLMQRGIRVQQLSKRHNPRDVGQIGGLSGTVKGAIQYDLQLRAEFSSEGLFSKISKIFHKELQVGDQSFDKAIFIRTDHPDLLREALQNEGFRAAIMHTVEETQQSLCIENNRVSFSTFQLGAKSCARLRCCVALILHHMQRFAVAKGLQQRPELGRFPDLGLDLEAPSDIRQLFIKYAIIDDLTPIGIAYAMTLQGLWLEDSSLISKDLTPLAKLADLQELKISNVPEVSDISPLAELTNLTELTVSGCPVSDIAPLSRRKSLVFLDLSQTDVIDLSPLSGLTELEKLNIKDTKVTDLSPLGSLSNLKVLWIRRSQANEDQVRDLIVSSPGLEIDPY